MKESNFQTLPEPDVVPFSSNESAGYPEHKTDVALGHETVTLRHMTNMDCGDKVCDVRYQLVPTCLLYVINNNTDCDIPCNLEDCLKEIRLNFVCPIWQCEEKVTTTTTTTSTTTITQLTTTQTPNDDISSLNVASLVGNVILSIFLAACLLYFKRRIIQMCTQTKNVLMSRLQRNNYRDSPTENIPLRSARFTPPFSVDFSIQEQSRPTSIVRNDPLFTIASSDESGSAACSGFSQFVNVNLGDEPDPDSIEAAVERSSGAVSLNQPQEPKPSKRSTKNVFSKKFWKRNHL